MNGITVIMTVFKRWKNLFEQLSSLENQIKKPDKYIFCINNKEEFYKFKDVIDKFLTKDRYTSVEFSENLGVWNRFYLAFNATTKFVYILDDDVLPGKYWLENCLKYSKNKHWIFWSWGSKFKNLKVRRDRDIISESSNRPDSLTLVNMSGQSWFFRKENLSEMFSFLLDKINNYSVCWEELLISWNASEKWINTYILPMTEDKDTRGNKDPRLWNDQHSGFNKYWNNLYQEFYLYCVLMGYSPMDRLKNNMS